MPPRTGRPRNLAHDFVNSQFLEQAYPPTGSSAGDNANFAPMAQTAQGAQPLEEQSFGEQAFARNYPGMALQAETRPPGEQLFIPDMPVSIMEDPRSRAKLKVSLAKLVTEAAPGARLEDDAAELLLFVASDFLSNLANFSCRLANHRGAENLTGQDVALYLEQMHGMHISLERTAAPPPPPPSAPAPPPPQGKVEAGGESDAGESPSPPQRREATPPLAKTRPRRHTNAAPPEVAQEEEEEEGDEEEEDGTDGGDNGDEGETDEERPRESRRLRERAIAAEKQVKQKKRGKVGRPRK